MEPSPTLTQYWTYCDRFCPEPTELQKTLLRDAIMFKEKAYQAFLIDQKLLKVEDPEIRLIYSQMYQLPPQRYPDADNNPTAPKHINQPQNL